MRQLIPSVREVAPEDLYDLYDLPGPHLRADFVASVDGAVVVDGTSEPLGSPADKAVFRALRAVSDAVVVGAGTARAEGYGPIPLSAAARSWRAEHGRAPEVPLVVVTRSGGLPESARSATTPVVVAAPAGTEVDADDVLWFDDEGGLVQALHNRGWSRLLCEGGPGLLTSLLRAGVVDELCLTTSTQLVGATKSLLADLPEPVGVELVSLLHDEPGVLLARWRVRR